MKLVRIGTNRDFQKHESGESFCVLVGRHEKHGGTKNHTVAMVELPRGSKSDSHFHEAREESYFVVSGEGIATIGCETARIFPGDLLYAEPGQRHVFEAGEKAPLRYLVITAPSWSPEDSFR